MKKRFLQLLVAAPVWVLLGSSSFAMCIWFAPPSRQFSPATNMQTLISRQGNTLTMTVQPEFSGDATDFGLVMPFPSLPELVEAPENIFMQLEDITNPELDFDTAIGLEAFDDCEDCVQISSGVTVVDQRDIGDYTATTLSATDGSELTAWLSDNGYEVPEAKQKIVEQYVGEASHFVALKVNMAEAEVSDDGVLEGALNPLSFVFDSEDTVLPLRLMGGEQSLVNLTVYTLADELTYIPGAQIQYSKKVDATLIEENRSLETYDPWQQWLVRNVVQFDPSQVEQDLTLQVTNDTLVVVPGEESVIFNPEQLKPGTGVVVSDDGKTIYTNEEPEATKELDAEPVSVVTTTLVVALALTNVILLILLGKKNSSQKRG